MNNKNAEYTEYSSDYGSPQIDNIESKRSELNAALSKHINNPRVSKITFAVSFDACTPGRNLQGTYNKQDTPAIPIEACSRPGGCNCRYIPVLTEIFP